MAQNPCLIRYDACFATPTHPPRVCPPKSAFWDYCRYMTFGDLGWPWYWPRIILGSEKFFDEKTFSGLEKIIGSEKKIDEKKHFLDLEKFSARKKILMKKKNLGLGNFFFGVQIFLGATWINDENKIWNFFLGGAKFFGGGGARPPPTHWTSIPSLTVTSATRYLQKLAIYGTFGDLGTNRILGANTPRIPEKFMPPTSPVPGTRRGEL